MSALFDETVGKIALGVAVVMMIAGFLWMQAIVKIDVERMTMVLAEVSGSGLFAVIGIGAAIGLVIFAIGAQADERSIVRSSLRQLDGYEVENVRDQELLNPLERPCHRAGVCRASPISGAGSRRSATSTRSA